MLVLLDEHFIKDKVEMDCCHLPNHWEELTIPNIRLLRCGRVEYPVLVVIMELWITRGVAVHLTKHVRIFVLRQRMEDIDRKPHSPKTCLANAQDVL